MSVVKKKPRKPEASLPVTEDSLAFSFVTTHLNSIRFDHRSGLWFLWDGSRWKANQTRLAVEWVRELVRAHSASENAKVAKEFGRVSVQFGVERLAQTDSRIAVLGEVFDADPLLLGTPGGTVDLVTGELRAADPADLISRSTAVAPHGDGLPPRWLAFLREATEGDGQMIAYLQVLCGYCLTGHITEQAMFFLFGPGGNGKSVFMNTICGILGEYAITAPMATFTAQFSERHETELAMLRGARLVRASETEEGRSWAEARIKALTGGEPITARFMRRDYFTFLPVFKLIVSGNHKPHLRSVDKAIARRIRMLPLLHVPAEVDPELELKLREEWPGILQWMIDGCLAWQEAGGFPFAEAVQGATKDYLDDQDLVAQFIDECCDSNPLPIDPSLPFGSLHSSAVRLLFSGYVIFCDRRKENPGSEKRFAIELEKRGYLRRRTERARKIVGLRLNDQAEKAVDARAGAL